MDFDYEGARREGYTDAEIKAHLLTKRPKYEKEEEGEGFLSKVGKNFKNFYTSLTDPYSTGVNLKNDSDKIDQRLLAHSPNFDIRGALDEGYSPEEINEHLESLAPEKSLFEKGARIAGQYGLGRAQGSGPGILYDLATGSLGNSSSQNVNYREQLGDELDQLQHQKLSGQWGEEDEARLNDVQSQLMDVEKSGENAPEPVDLSIRGLAEKATGQDLKARGVLEKAANWAGFVRTPNMPIGPGLAKKDILKAIAPTSTEVLRGLGAGYALQKAEEGEYGVIGTMAAAIAGDLAGGAGKGALNLITKPKQTIAKALAAFPSAQKKQMQAQIIKDFRDAGIQADLGTITDSNLIKWTQSRLAQSGLTGKKLDTFRKELVDSVVKEYKTLADEVGAARFVNSHQAGEEMKAGIEKIRQAEMDQYRKMYADTGTELKPDSYVDTNPLAQSIAQVKKQLKPGTLKSGEQKVVLDVLDKIEKDIMDSEGNIIFGKVEDLLNNKIALGDVINYEVQGGAKQLLKGINKELDKTIISFGKTNSKFAKKYIGAQKYFSRHAKQFRNKSISKMMMGDTDPSKLLDKMNSISETRKIKDILSKTKEGEQLFKDLSRHKMDQLVLDNLIDGVTGQAKLGKFSKLMGKKNTRETLKEILPTKSYQRLTKLQKNAGRLTDSADKFFNASKTGAVAADAAIIGKLITDVANLLYGNPWPLMKTTGGIVGARKLSSLLADAEFLKLVEEAIMAKTPQDISRVAELLKPYAVYAYQSSDEQEQPNSL